MSWEGVAAIIAVLLALLNGVYTIGVLAGRVDSMKDWVKDEIERARNRIDGLERLLLDWFSRWKDHE